MTTIHSLMYGPYLAPVDRDRAFDDPLGGPLEPEPPEAQQVVVGDMPAERGTGLGAEPEVNAPSGAAHTRSRGCHRVRACTHRK